MSIPFISKMMLGVSCVFKKQIQIHLTKFIIVIFVTGANTVVAAPYQQSDLIKGINFEFSTQFSHGPDSDQWPMTWATDGNMYSAWGDGRGWNVLGSKDYLGITKISGFPPNLTGTDLYGDNQSGMNRKPVDIIAYNNNLYLFWNPSNETKWVDIYGATSTDNGNTWSFTASPVFPVANGAIPCGFLKFGQGYTGIPQGIDANYVYLYLVDGPKIDGDNLYLARAPKNNIFQNSAYEYVSKIDIDNKVTWSKNWGDKIPVFNDPNGREYQAIVNYNPGIKKYILTKAHNISNLGIFESDTPWGPWKTIYYGQFKDNFWKFTYEFPQKWMSKNGMSMWMSFSGWPEYDNISFVRVTMSTSANKADTTPPDSPKDLVAD
ncbi:MAG: DUF4185 domain-containing protein [Gammaproteobacteria bacterium]|nr:DUF4185 domain-containing protein [Gammaproteobacteria bacterium]